VSYLQRHHRQDFTGDPWDGRTLEWSTSSPAPFYNFAVIPQVTDRDQFWVTKHAGPRKKGLEKKITYTDIAMPKNTPMGVYIAAFAFCFGFAAVWHIWWLFILGLVGGIVMIILRTHDEDSEYIVPAATVQKIEAEFIARKQSI
jgi:cytochrome o ubiquinol oxidase subunit 1